MKNLVMCFDSTNDHPGPRDATNAEALFRLLDATDDDRQLTWYDAGAAALRSPQLFNPAARDWREAVAAAAREAVIDAYFFLAEHWQPDDRIFLLGAGRGAYCARALARMLGTVGLLPDRSDNVLEYALGAYALPGISRTPREWHQIHRLACVLSQRRNVAVPVHFLGLWDTVKVPGTPRLSATGLVGQRRLGPARGRHRRRIRPVRRVPTSASASTPSRKSGSAAHTATSSAARTRTGRWRTSRSTGCSTVWSRPVRSFAPEPGTRHPHRPNSTRLPRARDRCASARCRTMRSCTPASTCICARIPTTGAGCRARIVWSDLDWVARAERLLRPDTAPAAKAAPAASDELTAVGVVTQTHCAHGINSDCKHPALRPA